MSGVRRDSRLMKDEGGQSLRRWRISAAIFVGTLLISCAFTFFSLRRFFFHRSDSEVVASSCESSQQILNLLKSGFAVASEKNARLEKEINDLTNLLRLTEIEKANARKEVLASSEKKKVGPFGTVKGNQTNPTVVPDESINPRLAKTLEKISVNHELIVTLATNRVRLQLGVWFTEIKRLNIPNHLVYALDIETVEFCQSNNVSFYKPDADPSLDSIAKTRETYAISSLKFRVLRELLQMGYSVLFSHVDVVCLQNPFDHLYRDSDVESMSDGHDNLTAYGYDAIFDDVKMGWSRYAYTMRIWVYNSGLFYIRPTIPCIELLDRVVGVLAREKVWDQQVFNEQLFYPSYPGYEGLHASRRTMDYNLFMNSKVLFKTVRKDLWLRKMKPVIVHMNYHPDKYHRMVAVVDYYVNGEKDALDNFPDGSRWM